MTTKEIAIRLIEDLPDDVSWEGIEERIRFVAGIRKGLKELDQGRGIAHDEVKANFAEWLKS